jgi:alpha-N-acetylglucosamine transferase
MEDLMDHFVTLETLPEGIEFPTDLRDKIWFDAETKKLFFRGYMSKTEFDRLCQITKDWSFRRKLEELFQMSVYEIAQDRHGVRGLFSLFRKRAVPS